MRERRGRESEFGDDGDEGRLEDPDPLGEDIMDFERERDEAVDDEHRVAVLLLLLEGSCSIFTFLNQRGGIVVEEEEAEVGEEVEVGEGEEVEVQVGEGEGEGEGEGDNDIEASCFAQLSLFSFKETSADSLVIQLFKYSM